MGRGQSCLIVKYDQAAIIRTGARPPWSHWWHCLGHTLTHIPSPTPGASQFLGWVLGRRKRWEVKASLSLSFAALSQQWAQG